MRYLLTGGTGFIGAAVTQSIIDRGDEAWVLTRSVEKARQVLPGSVHCVEQLADIALDTHFDGVINLAGEALAGRRWNTKSKALFVSSRIELTQQLVTFMGRLTHTPAVLVNASAVGFYGAREDELITEESPAGQEFTSDLCQQWEMEANKAAELGVRVCLVRIGVVLGKGGGAFPEMARPFYFGAGAKLGHGQQWLAWIHHQDMVNLLLYCLDHEGISGVYNGTAPTPVTNQTFTKVLAKVLKRPAWFTVPGFVLTLLVGEMARLLLTGQRVAPKRALESGFTFQYGEIEPALRNITAK